MLSGCSSVIKLPEINYGYNYKMFGKNGNGNFYYNEQLSDSVRLKWLSDTHGGFANTSVTILDHYVFIGDLSGRIYCFDFNTGKEIGNIKNKGAVNSAVLTKDDLIIYALELPNNNFTSIIFYDVKNGDELKNVKIPGKVRNELILLDDEIIFTTEEGMVYKYNLKGEEIWKYKINKKITAPSVCSDNLLAVITSDGQLNVFDHIQKKLLYKKIFKGNYESGSIIKDKVIYFTNNSGVVFACNLVSEKLLWQCELGYRIKSYPVFDNKNLYITNLHGDYSSLDLNTGKLNWVKSTDGLFEAAPIVSENILIIPDQNRKILFVSKSDGKILRILPLEGRVKLSPVVKDNSIIIGFEKGQIARYEFVK